MHMIFDPANFQCAHLIFACNAAQVGPKAFLKIVGLIEQRGFIDTGLEGRFRDAVHDIETRLREIDDPRLTSAMLMLRRHEKDFMLRRDEKYVGELKKTAADFGKSLAGADIQPAVKADIAAKAWT